MSKHLERDLEHLKRELLTMGSMVENAISRATLAIVERRLDVAREVLRMDDDMDRKEVEIEEECLKLLALHQPVAADLRYIITVLKVNNDLERMGDLAINVAERAAYLSARDPIGVPIDFNRMVERVCEMVKGSLDALVNRDTALARRVMDMDDDVDQMNSSMFGPLQKLMKDRPPTIKRAVHTLSASRHFERIADLATNIAEDVVFMVDGDLIRHQQEVFDED